MNRENMTWFIVLFVGILIVGVKAMIGDGMGKGYVAERQIDKVKVEVTNDAGEPEMVWQDRSAWDEREDKTVSAEILGEDGWVLYDQSTLTDYNEAMVANPDQTAVSFSLQRSIGIWIAALLTLFVLSFLIQDNPLYKIAESIFIGLSAAYWMVVGFWTTMVPNMIGKLSPSFVRGWSLPGLSKDEPADMLYLVPVALGVMLLWRLAPKGGWISRWPMSFIIGVFCGLRLITFLHADFLSQIRNGIVPMWGDTFWDGLRGFFLVVGVLTCLVYFFFSIEHKGVVGYTARVGIWFLMITFGAAFGYTVMGRIALLAIRLEFLFDDWLWLIDPTGKRVEAAEAVATVLTSGSPLAMIC